jgi:hypothetical protein
MGKVGERVRGYATAVAKVFWKREGNRLDAIHNLFILERLEFSDRNGTVRVGDEGDISNGSEGGESRVSGSRGEIG